MDAQITNNLDNSQLTNWEFTVLYTDVIRYCI